MQEVIIKKSQLVEAQITGTPAALQTYNFLPNNELSSKRIALYGIEAYTAAQLTTDNSGNAVIPANGAPSITFTLVTKGNVQTIKEMPVVNAIRSSNNGFILPLDNLEVTLDKCFITLNAATNLTLGQVVLFNFYYTEF